MSGEPGPRFGAARNDAERRAAHELRCAAIVESRWQPQDNFPDGVESDEEDDDAIHLVGLFEGNVVATMRLIVEPPRVERLLREHGLTQLYGADDTMFAGRLTVARPFRSRSRELTVGLYAELIEVASDRGIRQAISFLAENAVRFYRTQGMPLKLVGPPREDTGVLRRPAVFDIDVLEAFMGSASDEEKKLMIEHGAPPP